jgi:hypothetical protein
VTFLMVLFCPCCNGVEAIFRKSLIYACRSLYPAYEGVELFKINHRQPKGWLLTNKFLQLHGACDAKRKEMNHGYQCPC